MISQDYVDNLRSVALNYRTKQSKKKNSGVDVIDELISRMLITNKQYLVNSSSPFAKRAAAQVLMNLVKKCRYDEAEKLLVFISKGHLVTVHNLYELTQEIFLTRNDFDCYSQLYQFMNEFRDPRKIFRHYEYILMLLQYGKLSDLMYFKLNTTEFLKFSFIPLPEHKFIESLINLYLGLAYFAVACRTGSETEAATFRLAEVEAFIQKRIPCDIFVYPLVKLYKNNGRIFEAYSLLRLYENNLPENPNVYRYMEKLLKPLNSSEMEQILQVENYGNGNTDDERLEIKPVFDSLSGILQNEQKRMNEKDLLLSYQLKYSLSVLPEPCPALPASTLQKDFYYCPKNKHLPTIRQLISLDCVMLALKLLAELLDHPSWGRYQEVWDLLDTTLVQHSKYNVFIKELYAPRLYWWNAQFESIVVSSGPALSNKIKHVLDLLSSL